MAGQIPLYSRDVAKHILEQMNCEENKDKTVSFQAAEEESRDGNRSGRSAGRVTGLVEILRPAGQAD